MQVCEGTQGLAVGVPDVSTTGVGVVVVGRRLEDEALELPALGDVEQLGVDHIVVAHLVPGDVVESLLRIGVGVISVLIGIAFGLHPERAVLMEELDVHRLVPEPGAILQPRATYAHHADRVAVVPEEIGVGLNEARSQDTRGVDHDRPDHGGLHQSDGRHVGEGGVRRLVTVERVVDVHARRTGNVQREGGRTVAGRLTENRHRGIPVVEGSRRSRIGRIGRGLEANLPISGAVHVPGPAVVLLVRADVRPVGVALNDGARGIGEHHGLLLALVNPEVGVQVAPSVEVASLRLPTAHDHQEPIRWYDGAGRDLEFGGVVHVVGQVPTANVNRPRGLIVELDEVLVVARNVERVVGTRKFVDDDLRTQGQHEHPEKGQEREQVSVQIQGSAMYGE